MAVKASQLTYANTDKEALYLDSSAIESDKNKIKKDYNNIITDLDNINKAYTTLLNHKNTKGSWKTTLTSCTKSCKKKRDNNKTVKSSLESRITSDVLTYVLYVISNLNNVDNAATNLDSSSDVNV